LSDSKMILAVVDDDVDITILFRDYLVSILIIRFLLLLIQ